MGSLGYGIGALVWGAPVAALLVGVLTAIAVVRWRRKAIAALERAELDADVQQSAKRPAGTGPTQVQLIRGQRNPRQATEKG